MRHDDLITLESEQFLHINQYTVWWLYGAVWQKVGNQIEDTSCNKEATSRKMSKLLYSVFKKIFGHAWVP